MTDEAPRRDRSEMGGRRDGRLDGRCHRIGVVPSRESGARRPVARGRRRNTRSSRSDSRSAGSRSSSSESGGGSSNGSSNGTDSRSDSGRGSRSGLLAPIVLAVLLLCTIVVPLRTRDGCLFGLFQPRLLGEPLVRHLLVIVDEVGDGHTVDRVAKGVGGDINVLTLVGRRQHAVDLLALLFAQ